MPELYKSNINAQHRPPLQSALLACCQEFAKIPTQLRKGILQANKIVKGSQRFYMYTQRRFFFLVYVGEIREKDS